MSAKKQAEKSKKEGRKNQWKQDPEAVKADILKVAIEEFSTNGLAGARIDEIARKTTVSKRMIYYYFGSKDGLYKQVLESIYNTLRQGEELLDIANSEPVEALKLLVEATFNTHSNNPEFVRLVMIENVHHGHFLRESETIPVLNKKIIQTLEAICERGKKQGVFRQDIDAVQLHWFMSSFSFYNISNRATFSVSFGEELFSDRGQEKLKQQAVEMILASVITKDTSSQSMGK